MVILLSRASGPGCCRRVSTCRCVQISGATSVPSTLIGNSAIVGGAGVTVNADSNLVAGFVVLVPTSPLLKGQTYSYTFSVTLKSGGAVTTKTARFTTNP